MTADCQLGLPGIGIQEDRIAINSSLECHCGLNHFVPCDHRNICLGLYKAAERQAEVNYYIFLTSSTLERIPAK